MREEAVRGSAERAEAHIRKLYETGCCASLEDILRAKEERAERQKYIIGETGKDGDRFCLISFTLNIAGAVKNCSLFSRAFRSGDEAIEKALEGAGIRTGRKSRFTGGAGREMMAAVFEEAKKVKALTCEIEETHPLGRIFDIDVIDEDGLKVSREALDASRRRCLICGRPAFRCARSRAHRVEDVLKRQIEIVTEGLADEGAELISGLAEDALTEEAHIGPKPGLVDRFGRGAHRDMDEAAFIMSAKALRPYFRDCAYAGIHLEGSGDRGVLNRLKELGIQAEKTMLSVTAGANTHKGAIFSMGIFSCAAGMCVGSFDGSSFKDKVKILGKAMSQLIEEEESSTAGARALRDYGIGGIRKEAALGYPSVFGTGVPVFTSELRRGMGGRKEEIAALKTLLGLIAVSEDTNIIARGGIEGYRWLKEQAEKNLGAMSEDELIGALTDMDRECVEKNISPGGSADLLGLTLFTVHATYFLKKWTGALY